MKHSNKIFLATLVVFSLVVSCDEKGTPATADGSASKPGTTKKHKDAGTEPSTDASAAGKDSGPVSGVDASMSDSGMHDSGAATPTPDAGAVLCAGTGLAKFHPSNLPVPLVVPSGLKPLHQMLCAFNTDSSDPDDTTVTTPHWQHCSGAPALPPWKIVNLKDGREAVVLFAESFRLATGEYLYFTGQRPIIIVTTGKIDISGTIAFRASKADSWAAGGAPAPSTPGRSGVCPIDTILGGGRAGATDSATGIGAGGGGFCGVGGAGSGNPAGSAGPAGGVAYGTADLIPLVGGSAGGTSVYGDTNNIVVGGGGGAIQLVSGTEILIGDSGVINAGGGRATNRAGGGSGGAILLEAPTVTVKGVIAANGGSGSNGEDGQPTDQAAVGGDLGHGGNGGAAGTVNGSLGNAAGTTLYSAGGGGGAGRIRINTGCGGDAVIAGTAIISPFESTGCFSKGGLN